MQLTEIEGIPGAERVLAALIDARLVTVGAGTVELSHEALLREWPRYRGWLEEDRVGRQLHAHLGLPPPSGTRAGGTRPTSTGAPGSRRRSSSGLSIRVAWTASSASSSTPAGSKPSARRDASAPRTGACGRC